MNVEIANRKLAKQYLSGKLTRAYGPVIAASFEELLALILAVANVSELYAFKGARPEKLQGGKDEYSMRLNNKMRLIYTLGTSTVGEDGEEHEESTLLILRIEDYH